MMGMLRANLVFSRVSRPAIRPSCRAFVTNSNLQAPLKRLPEFSLADKVILVSGAARGLCLTQAEALLEAGATGNVVNLSLPQLLITTSVYALDRLPEPSPDFGKIQKRAQKELGCLLHYRQIDVRNSTDLNMIVEDIGNEHGRLELRCSRKLSLSTTQLKMETKCLRSTPLASS